MEKLHKDDDKGMDSKSKCKTTNNNSCPSPCKTDKIVKGTQKPTDHPMLGYHPYEFAGITGNKNLDHVH